MLLPSELHNVSSRSTGLTRPFHATRVARTPMGVRRMLGHALIALGWTVSGDRPPRAVAAGGRQA
jgi:hypothetical protein